MSAFQYFSFSSVIFLPLAWLWFRLIDHLRVEWSVNPQYAYGWAVPFMCAYLLWLGLKDHAGTRLRDYKTTGLRDCETARRRDYETTRPRDQRATEVESSFSAEVGSPVVSSPVVSSPVVSGPVVSSPVVSSPVVSSPVVSSPVVSSPVVLWSLFLLAFLYLPTRLVQEANPEWRLVSWALALEVIGITLLCLWSYGPVVRGPWSRSLLFPLCFFLVAVPWPTFIEGPLTQGLMRTNVGVTIELLGLLGIPAAQHGNVIEIATGMVGVDDACSGIRSLQATLMISLFLGEIYALTARRRALCAFAGFALSFLFNVARTTLLTWVAAHKGTDAIASWHDPAGVTILVACFLCLWLIARGLRGKDERLKAEMGEGAGQGTKSGGAAVTDPVVGGRWSVVNSPVVRGPAVTDSVVSGQWSVVRNRVVALSLFAWLLLVEAGTELWYRSHEWGVPQATTWRVEFPRDNATYRELPLSDKTRQFLRYDDGYNGTWQEGADKRWQAIFLRWNAGRIAVHLAKSHTPEACLTAAGREVVSQSGLRPFAVKGMRLPFRSYVVKDASGPLHVFYCLWEDRASAQSFRTTHMTYASRLAPVLAGRRNSGQRSLEVAVWGIPDEKAAEAALAHELETLIKVEQ